jgi:2-C-methyl-D-erythritol 2,4-cyclodiphosphate synthase
LKRVRQAGYAIANIDASLILAAPKIGPHAGLIRLRLAELLGIAANCVGLKAKTPEGLNSENAVLAHAVVLLEGIQKKSHPRPSTLKKRAP